MELQHFSHSHTLIFKELHGNGGQIPSCFGCDKPIFGPSYSCDQCNFFLHEECAELPPKIKHPLFLLCISKLPPIHDPSSLICHFCENIVRGNFIYCCSICDFNLEINCGLLPCVIEPHVFQKHRFKVLDEQIPTICDACGYNGDSCAYFCTLCHAIVHYDCLYSLYPPATMEIPGHTHLLTYTFFLHDDEFPDVHCCNICNDEILRDKGCYHCTECSYVVHVGCVFGLTIFTDTADIPLYLCSEEVEVVEDLAPLNELRDSSITPMMQDIILREDDAGMVFYHFSHKHALILNDEQRCNDIEVVSCFGCKELILGSSYSCNHCKFYLHKTCAELPHKIKHPLHRRHPLLLKEYPYPGQPFCNWCYREFSSRFVYNCSACETVLDIECGLLSCTIEPDRAQGHHLIRLMRPIPFTCAACGIKERDEYAYFCTLCQLRIHPDCTSMQNSVRISGHEHLLTHYYFIQEDDGDESEKRSSEFWKCEGDAETINYFPFEEGKWNCGICEEKVNTCYGSHYCSECKFISHVRCAIDNIAAK